jgi:transposase InsO family protein
MSRKQPLPNDLEERNTQVALFRYGLIAPLIFNPLAKGELEGALRAIASKTYAIPYSQRTRVGIATLRRYLKLYQHHGFDALRPQERADKRSPRAFPPEVVEKAIALREEQPARTTPMIVNILKQDESLQLDQPLNAHTLTTHLRLHGKTRRLLAHSGRVFQRFEREHANSLWQGDLMFGPWLPDPNHELRVAGGPPGKKRRAHLFCFLDDHSRLVPYAEFFFDEALPRMERVLKVGILRRGVPQAIYVDNGKVYQATQFAVACASLGIQQIHAAPYSPEGKGKQERFFETVRLQFMPEVEVSEITTLTELNESFWAWLECIYHRAVHRETDQTPLERYQQGLHEVRTADPETLRKAFLWREMRKVRKDGSIELQGNRYLVDLHLAGRKLELRFDPFDLSNLEVFLEGISLGKAAVLQQGREQHIAVEHLVTQSLTPPKPHSSLDYLAALRAEYQVLQRQQAGPLQFTRLSAPSQKGG